MTKGVVFVIYGLSPRVELATALWSIRTVYDGPLHVMYYATDMELIAAIADLPDVTTGEYIVDPDFMVPEERRARVAAWCMKAHGHAAQYPFDLNLYYDLDHIWQSPIDMKIFEQAQKHELVNPWIHRSKPQIFKRVRNVPHIARLRLSQYITANGGCVCAKRGSAAVMQWLGIIKDNLQVGNYYLKKNPEEIALGVMLSIGRAKALPWRWSAPFPSELETGCACALHGPRGRFVRSPLWRAHAKEAVDADFLGITEFLTPFWKQKIGVADEDRTSG